MFYNKKQNKCHAIINNETNKDKMELCTNKMIGTTCSINYCSKHAPSGASPGLFRLEPVQFYDSKNDKIITKK